MGCISALWRAQNGDDAELRTDKFAARGKTATRDIIACRDGSPCVADDVISGAHSNHGIAFDAPEAASRSCTASDLDADAWRARHHCVANPAAFSLWTADALRAGQGGVGSVRVG